jgi:RNA polymerase sigma factor (sigma-70 family)
MSRSASVSERGGRGVAGSARRALASTRSDERLARLVARDGEAPFAELYARHHQALYRYCRSIVRDEHDAQDALQNAMAGAFAALRKGERDLAVRPWLFRIAHNESISLLRRRRPQELAADELTIAAPANLSEPGLVVEQRERLATLLRDLRGLTLRQRSVLVMRELNGLSIAEIAAACQSTPGAVKQTLFEAREALRENEQGRSMECEQVRRLIFEEDRRTLRGRRVSSHLRSCAGCQELAQTIATREQDLRVLAPPLPAAAAGALLARLLDAGAGAGVHAGAASGASTGAASGAPGGAAGGAQAAAAGSSGAGAGTGGVGAAAGGAAPSIAAHAGGAIAAKFLVTAAVVAAGAAGVVGVTSSGSRHHGGATRAGSPRNGGDTRSSVRAGAGSGRLGGSGSAPHSGDASSAAKRALVHAHDRSVAGPHANGPSHGQATAHQESGAAPANAPGHLHAGGRHNPAHASPGQSAGAPGRAKKARPEGGSGKSHRRRAEAKRPTTQSKAGGKGRPEEHPSSRASQESGSREPPARGGPSAPEGSSRGSQSTQHAATSAPLEGQSTPAQATPGAGNRQAAR